MKTKNRKEILAELALFKTQLQYWSKYDWNLFAPDKFNWEEDSWAVAAFAPHLIDKNLYNWNKFSREIAECAPGHFDKELFNWKDCSAAIFQHCPEHFDADRFNYEDNDFLGMLYCEPDSLNLNAIPSREFHKLRKMNNALGRAISYTLQRGI